MEYRDQGYAGKSVPAEWLVVLGARGRKGCEKSRPSRIAGRNDAGWNGAIFCVNASWWRPR